MYIGAFASERFVRIYDKAAEQGMPGIDHIRIEAQLKNQYARAAYAALRRGATIASIIRGIVDYPHYDVWTEAFECEPTLLPGAVHDTDTVSWLKKVCLPSLRRCIQNGSIDPEFVRAYLFEE